MRANAVVLCWALLVAGCAGVETPGAQGGSWRPGQRTAYLPDLRGGSHPGGAEPGAASGTRLRQGARRMPLGTALVTLHPGEKTRQAVELGLLEVDPFEKLLIRAGLDDLEELPPRVNPFTPGDAAEALGLLLGKPVTLGNFPPRMAAGHLLREVLARGDVSREEMVRRVARFEDEVVAVLRPDGYLAWALDGRTQQKAAPVQWKDGAFRSHGFELGLFYSGRNGVFRLVDERLRVVDGRVLTEVHDDADVISRTLDGAEDAFVDLSHALGQMLSRPMETVAGLRNLPTALAALISSSPAYWERFRYMTSGEQMRAVAKLVTSIIATWGTASATTRTMSGALVGAESVVPVLSLSAEGSLGVVYTVVPVGRAVAVLSGGPGAAIILQRAGQSGGGASPPSEPGRWKAANENMPEDARRYQAQVTGAPRGYVYDVDGVKFDGFKDGVLLEAKGPNYAKFLPDAAEQGGWFQGFQGMVEQAKRQQRVANGIPVHWHFAERKVADFVEQLFIDNDLGDIQVIFTEAR